ncbi:unnamed protein product [Sympodiomycopsis kandeliae]
MAQKASSGSQPWPSSSESKAKDGIRKDLTSRAKEAAAALERGEHPIGAFRKVKPDSSSTSDTMAAWRAYRDATRPTVLSTYQILGFLSSGTYGRVYKACLRDGTKQKSLSEGDSLQGKRSRVSTPASTSTSQDSDGSVFAIKKFKPDKESEASTYTGISQSAMREIALNRELKHENVVTLRQVMLEDRSIYMIFSYASHDFLQLIHHHSAHLRAPIAGAVLKSLLFQLLSGVHYLHSNWVLHRDLKPANILLTYSGVVKIGDLGLARLYSQPLQPLYNGDRVVVTIWYRAPELLMGTRHYTTAIDMWAVGCIWGELLGLRPLFKGEEAKVDGKTKGSALQTDQMTRIIEVLGVPNTTRWPSIDTMPDWRGYLQSMRLSLDTHQNVLYNWYTSRFRSSAGFSLLQSLLQYDPLQRKSAKEALEDEWFKEEPVPTRNVFASLPNGTSIYPQRRLHSDTTDPVMAVDPVQVAQQQQQQQQQQQLQLQLQKQQQQQQQLQAQQQTQSKAPKSTSSSLFPPTTAFPPAGPIGGPLAPAPAPASASSSLAANSVDHQNMASVGPHLGLGPGTNSATGTNTSTGTTNNLMASAAALGISAGNLGIGSSGLDTGMGFGMGLGLPSNTSTTANPSTTGRGGMVATAAANATREQQNKRAKMG